jgi:hypothetical protein
MVLSFVSVTEANGLRTFENQVLREILKRKYQAVGGNCVTTWFMICTTGKYYNNQIKDDDNSGTSGIHVKEETEHTLE